MRPPHAFTCKTGRPTKGRFIGQHECPKADGILQSPPSAQGPWRPTVGGGLLRANRSHATRSAGTKRRSESARFCPGNGKHLTSRSGTSISRTTSRAAAASAGVAGLLEVGPGGAGASSPTGQGAEPVRNAIAAMIKTLSRAVGPASRMGPAKAMPLTPHSTAIRATTATGRTTARTANQWARCQGCDDQLRSPSMKDRLQHRGVIAEWTIRKTASKQLAFHVIRIKREVL